MFSLLRTHFTLSKTLVRTVLKPNLFGPVAFSAVVQLGENRGNS